MIVAPRHGRFPGPGSLLLAMGLLLVPTLCAASDFPDASPVIEVGANTAGTLRGANDVNYFRFEAKAAGLYIVETRGELNVRIVVLDALGAEMACGRGVEATVKARLHPGWHMLKIYPGDGDTGMFLVKVRGPVEVVNWLNLAIVIAGGLGLFLFGMRTLSAGLQRAAGDRIRRILAAFTSNRVLGVVSGTMSTAIVQSSSATTVMVISFVNAGLLNLRQAVAVIMGANIGTTVTAWIVSLVGKFSITSLCYPAIALGAIFSFFRQSKSRAWGSVLLGFGILFFGLFVMKDALGPLRDDPAVMGLFGSGDTKAFPRLLICIGLGTLVTLIVQSSSAVMAITATLAMNGVIDFPTAAALVLGENIGTTITANLASIGTVTGAKRAARAHFLFNLFGVLWMVPVFPTAIRLLVAVLGPAEESTVATHIAVFHSTFNLINTLLLLPFLDVVVRIVTTLVPGRTEMEERHLKYIDPGFIAMPAVAIEAARKELLHMFELSRSMLRTAMDVLFHPGGKKTDDRVESIFRNEAHVDMLEREIQTYLAELSQQSVTPAMAGEIAAMFDMANDIERIADHGESLVKLLQRKVEKNLSFSDNALDDIREIYGVVGEQLDYLYDHFMSADPDALRQIRVTEQRINKIRKLMRRSHVDRIKEQVCNVESGLIFIDMLTSFEKIGDHAVNVGEAMIAHRMPEADA